MDEPVAPEIETLRLLLVDDDAVDRTAVIRALRQSRQPFKIEGIVHRRGRAGGVRAGAVRCGVARLPPARHGWPRSSPADERTAVAARPAILMLTGMDDDALAIRCIEAGAQDFLLKQELTPRHLMRAGDPRADAARHRDRSARKPRAPARACRAGPAYRPRQSLFLRPDPARLDSAGDPLRARTRVASARPSTTSS